MSHVTLKEAGRADQQITDLGCLQRAAEKLGGVWKNGQKHFRTWASDHGRLVGDYPVPAGYTEAEIKSGKGCQHAIGLGSGREGSTGYEVGVMTSKKFPGTYSLMYDFYGEALDQQFGKGLGKLMTGYHAEVVKKQAAGLGDICTEQTLPDGTILLEVDTTVRLGG